MFPVIGVITYHDLEEAITIAYDNLQNEGIGHSVVSVSYTHLKGMIGNKDACKIDIIKKLQSM